MAAAEVAVRPRRRGQPPRAGGRRLPPRSATVPRVGVEAVVLPGVINAYGLILAPVWPTGPPRIATQAIEDGAVPARGVGADPRPLALATGPTKSEAARPKPHRPP